MKFVIAALLALFAAPAWGVGPRLTSIQPTGAQRGTQIEVHFGGQRLADTEEIVFYGPGISVVKLTETKANQVNALLQVASDCRLGEHQIRLRTKTGVSELRTFWVNTLTNVAEVEPNNDLAKAQAVPLNVTLTGTVTSEDVDCFVVSLKKGEHLCAEIEGMRLGRGAFDPHLTILDRRGQTVVEVEDSLLLLQDATVAWVAPEPGEYVVQVRETSFGGREDYHYRLHLGTFPRPTAVHPAAGRAGETLKVRFIGDGHGEFEQEVTLPAKPQEKFGVYARLPAANTQNPASASSEGNEAPSPNWMRVTPHPCVLEAEPNDTREQAGEAREVPVVFNGILSKPGDHDWFRFRARKGQNLQVAVFARRLRSPVDSAIQVVTAKGEAVADNDDGAGPDSVLTVKPDQNGEYAVLVRDHLKRGGPDFVYCLEIAPVEPSLTVKIPEVARNDTQSRQYIAVPRGNRFATLVSLKRNQLSSDVALRVDGLPEGVQLQADLVPAKIDQFPVVFTASPEAPITGKLLDLVATATNGVEGRFRNDIELVQGPNNSSYFGTRVDKLLVAVTEAAPFKLRIVEPSIPLVQAGTMDLKVVAEREKDFDEPITVKMLWNPPGVTSLPDMTIPKGATSVIYVLNAKIDAELRSWKLAVLGSAKVDGGDLFVSSPLTKLEIGAPYLTAKIETTACTPGQSTNVKVRIEQRIPFAGQATIRLLGLPEKVTVPEQQITKDDQEVVFPVKVDPNCPTGSHRNLFCSVAVPKEGDAIMHQAGQGGVFRIVPPKKIAGGAAAKVAKN